MPKWKHLSPAENVLWSRWMEKYGHLWHDYQYDVYVGKGRPPLPEWPDWLKELQEKLSRRRLDVLAWRDGVLWIFEIKPQAGLSALGQVLGYRELYRRDTGYDGEIKLAIVTDVLWEDIEYVYQKFDIVSFVLPPPLEPPLVAR